MSGAESRPVPLIESRIFLIRGQKVLLDSDLASLYDVSTGALNQAVKRNRERFPEDFMFQLSSGESEELESLRSQTVILKRGHHRKYAPYAFTEQGIAMLSSVLRSPRAIEVNIAIMRTFVRFGNCWLLTRNWRAVWNSSNGGRTSRGTRSRRSLRRFST